MGQDRDKSYSYSYFSRVKLIYFSRVKLIYFSGVKLVFIFFRYLQDILEEHEAKPKGARPGSGNGITHGNGVKAKIPVSQVDIMQMLSKAQQEYDTVSSTCFFVM